MYLDSKVNYLIKSEMGQKIEELVSVPSLTRTLRDETEDLFRNYLENCGRR